jgi:hypothetical protein
MRALTRKRGLPKIAERSRGDEARRSARGQLVLHSESERIIPPTTPELAPARILVHT